MKSCILVLIASSLMFVGCAAQRKKEFEAYMESNLGKSYDAIIVQYGPPTKEAVITDGKVLEWIWNHGTSSKGTVHNVFGTPVVTGSTQEKSCLVRYVFKNEKVEGWYYFGHCF